MAGLLTFMICARWGWGRKSTETFIFFYKQVCTICIFPGGIGTMLIYHTAAGLVGQRDIFSRCLQSLEIQVFSIYLQTQISSDLTFHIMFLSLLSWWYLTVMFCSCIFHFLPTKYIFMA